MRLPRFRRKTHPPDVLQLHHAEVTFFGPAVIDGQQALDALVEGIANRDRQRRYRIGLAPEVQAHGLADPAARAVRADDEAAPDPSRSGRSFHLDFDATLVLRRTDHASPELEIEQTVVRQP